VVFLINGLKMSLVSITKAAQLSGKSVRTIQRHLSSGKLSFVMTPNNIKSIDTSELIRVYGHITSGDDATSESCHVIKEKMSNDVSIMTKEKPLEHQIDLLKLELEAEKRLSNERLQTIDTLKSTLKLLEHKKVNNTVDPVSSNEQEVTTNENIVELQSNQGFLRRLKTWFK